MKDFTTTISNIKKNLETSSSMFTWEDYTNGTMGSFMKALAKAFQEADIENLEKLEKAFPEVSKLFVDWKSSGRTNKVSEL